MQVREPPEGPLLRALDSCDICRVTWVFEITVQEKKKKECQYSNIQSSGAISFLVDESIAYIQIIL